MDNVVDDNSQMLGFASSAGAGTHRRHRRRPYRRHDSQSSSSVSNIDDDTTSSFSSWKVFAVIGVVAVCFGTLCPRLFAPMLSTMFGQQQSSSANYQDPTRSPPASMPGRARDHPHMHPGMRMAQAGDSRLGQQSTPSTSGKGMWTWLLPFYAIGVVAFLLYYLSKILFKSKKKKRRDKRRLLHDYDDDSTIDTDDDSTGRRPVDIGGTSRMSKRDLRGLQRRLRQTEEAMNKILQQLENVADNPEQAKIAHQLTKATLDQLSARPATGTDDKYLNDLENALHEFKNLSEKYAPNPERNDDDAKIAPSPVVDRNSSESEPSEVDEDIDDREIICNDSNDENSETTKDISTLRKRH